MYTSVNHNLMAANTARNLNGHYGRLATSTQRLSSGLRINSAADDAAGLAIRELQRADIAALHQGARNANDAISMIQVADGALSIIDEKLIRMKELAEQAATGTYDSTQRLMIDSEFQAMASEIDRIANATDFNGIHLLDGSLAGEHDGSKLTATGKMKIHFGSGNDSAEDYYYVEIGNCATGGLGLRESSIKIESNEGEPVSLLNLPGATVDGYTRNGIGSGIVPMSFIPKGSKNVTLIVDGILGAEDDIQLFTRDGVHLAGTKIVADSADNDYTWARNGIHGPDDLADIMTPANGFAEGAKYQALSVAGGDVSGEFNDGDIITKKADDWGLDKLHDTTVTFKDGGDMKISYSGDYDRIEGESNDGNILYSDERTKEKIIIDEAKEDILIVVSGRGIFDLAATWEYMPPGHLPDKPGASYATLYGDLTSIKTQQSAQEALVTIDEAIVKKDNIRAHLGALQNRLENTVTNLNIQAENMQAAESRISDVDVATEMTDFVRNQILTQSAVAMLGQANSLPQMMMQLISG